MYALDFEYDKRTLSDYGFIVCDFNSPSGADVVDVGCDVTFNTVPMHRGKKRATVSTSYEECLRATIHICKNPDETKDMCITRDEYRDLVRWLCREEYLPFRIIYADDFECETCYFDASFHVNRIEINKILYGLELTIETNCPFGYGVEQRKRFEFSEGDLKKKMHDNSDVIGSIYPDMTITCLSDGDLSLSNETLGLTMLLKNCVNGEVITIHGEPQIILSSVDSHKVYDDFNFQFFKIGNTFYNNLNTITASIPCIVDIRYRPTIFSAP